MTPPAPLTEIEKMAGEIRAGRNMLDEVVSEWTPVMSQREHKLKDLCEASLGVADRLLVHLRAHEWISCAERLPDTPCVCLVTTDGGTVGERFWTGKLFHSPHSGVIAWRSLPPAWGGER